jgi:hypothetical protein
VIPRKPREPEWRWGLRLRAWGVEGALEKVGRSSVAVLGNRIEYKREGIREWYVNDRRGLEQGFTVEGLPEGAGGGAGRWLVVRMEVLGDLRGSLDPGSSGVEFRTRGESVCSSTEIST